MFNSIIKPIAVYLGTSWVILEAFSYFVNRYEYPHYYIDLLIYFLGFGLVSYLLYSWKGEKFLQRVKWLSNGLHTINLFAAIVTLNYVYNHEKNAEIQHKSIEASVPSLAVLPFEVISPDQENMWLGDILCSRMIDQIEQIQSIDVKSKSSSFYFKDKDYNPVQIANLLGVNTLVEGDILVIDSTLQISVKLVNPITGSQIWNETFSRPLKNLMETQAELAILVAQKIGGQLTSSEKEKIRKPITNNSQAYQAYMKGRYHFDLVTVADNKRAHDYFQKATELDPKFPEAYAFLGMTYDIFGGYWLGVTPEVAYSKIKSLSNKISELAPNLPMGLFLEANYHYFYERDYIKGLQIAQKAFELSENKDDMIWLYCMMLSINKEVEKSYKILKDYVESNPTSAQAYQGFCHATLMKFGRDLSVDINPMIEICNKAMELDPSLVYNKYYIAELLFLRKQYKAANGYFKELYDLAPALHFTEGLFRTHYFLNEKELAHTYLKQIYAHHKVYPVPYRLAMVHATMQNIDSVVYYLKYAFDFHDIELVALWNETGFDPVRHEPQFQELLARQVYAGYSTMDANKGKLLFNEQP